MFLLFLELIDSVVKDEEMKAQFEKLAIFWIYNSNDSPNDKSTHSQHLIRLVGILSLQCSEL